jgi:CheY-like chemotaxis protein
MPTGSEPMINRDADGLASACTILVIDDDKDVREVMREVLEFLGYRAVPLCSGIEAIDYLRAGSRADAAIIDLCLPVMDGTQVIRALRSIRPSLAVLLVSGDLGAGEMQFDSDVALLKKPFAIKEIDGALRSIVMVRAIRGALAEKGAGASAG